MKNTTNYKLKKPEGTDVVNVEDFNSNADIIDGKLKELETNEIFYAVATGSANNYTVSISALSTLSTYFDGLAVCVKINNASTGASTVNVNGWGAKAIVDSMGNPITNGGLKKDMPYTLRYNGVNFILQGKGGGGNVTSDKLLIGATATGDSGAVVGTMPDNGAINITPGATAKTIPQGYTSGGTVAGDSNLITGNIKAGVSIFGVTGKSSVVDTADGLATASQLLAGASAYVNGLKVLGNIQSRSATTYNPSTTAQTIPQGLYLSGDQTIAPVTGTANVGHVLAGYGFNSANGINLTGTIPSKGTATITPGTTNQTIASGQYISGNQTIAGDSNLIASNIKSGVSIFGVNGNATPSSLGGLSLVASGTINGGSVGTNATIVLPSSYIGQAKYWYGSVTIQFTNGPGTWNFYGLYNSINSSAPYSCNYWRSAVGWTFVANSTPVIYLTSTVSATSYAITYYAYN